MWVRHCFGHVQILFFSPLHRFIGVTAFHLGGAIRRRYRVGRRRKKSSRGAKSKRRDDGLPPLAAPHAGDSTHRARRRHFAKFHNWSRSDPTSSLEPRRGGWSDRKKHRGWESKRARAEPHAAKQRRRDPRRFIKDTNELDSGCEKIN